jgi:hypothetical protein
MIPDWWQTDVKCFCFPLTPADASTFATSRSLWNHSSKIIVGIFTAGTVEICGVTDHVSGSGTHSILVEDSSSSQGEPSMYVTSNSWLLVANTSMPSPCLIMILMKLQD